VVARIRSEGPLVVNSGAEPLTVPLPSHREGDMIILAISSHFGDASLSEGTNDVQTTDPDYSYIGRIGGVADRFQLRYRIAGSTGGETDPVITRVQEGTPTAKDSFAARAFVVRDVNPALTPVIAGSGGSATGTASIPAASVVAADSLVLQIFMANEAISPTSFGPYLRGSPATSSVGIGVSIMQATLESDPSGPGAAPTEPVATTNWSGWLALALAPAAAINAVGFERERLRLGCADSYQVFVTVTDPLTLEPNIVDAVGWSKIRWGRVLDDVSQASVQLPDQYGGVYCCAKYGGIRPWAYGLRIERNDQLVWTGPITSVTRPSGDYGTMPYLQVTAHDMLARFQKRLATRSDTLNFTNTDAGVVLATIINETARISGTGDGFKFRAPSVWVGAGITREIVAKEFEIAWDVLDSILSSAVDSYVLNGLLTTFEPTTGWWQVTEEDGEYIIPGPYHLDSGELIYGLFTEASYKQRPGWSVSGQAQGNVAWVPGADSGDEGFRRYWVAQHQQSIGEVGVLDIVDPNPLYRATDDAPVISDEAFQRRADSLVALRGFPPAIIEGGALSDDAPISVDHLRPGSIWRMDIADACFGQLLQLVRLKRVEVEVEINETGGLEESISPSLYPLGYVEADLA
jgi:hypothetical protein